MVAAIETKDAKSGALLQQIIENHSPQDRGIVAVCQIWANMGQHGSYQATKVEPMMKRLMIGAALLGLASPAMAADVISEAPVSYDWSGPYIGAQIGYGWARDHVSDESRFAPGFSDYSERFNMDGVTGGAYAGYNYQMGSWVVGAEVDAELSGVSGDTDNWPFGDVISAKIRAQGSLRGRLGYAFDNNLIYATGGLAVANIKTSYTDGLAEDSYSKTRAGWTLGAGFEHAFTPNWIGRVEYRYTDFGKITDWAQTTDSGFDYHNRITEHAVRIGVSYKF